MTESPDQHEQIALRAYEFWEQRGQPWGTPEEDWFRAEQELADSEPALSKLAREVGAAVGKVVAILS